MYHLILTACLAADPAICAPMLLPAGDQADKKVCLAGADAITQPWLAVHDDLTGQGISCLPTSDLPALDIRQIAPDVFIHLGQPVSMERSSDGHIANLGIIIGDSVVVIDSGTDRAQGQQLYAAIRKLTDKPISHLVLTHMHPDHVLGAQVFAEAGANIVAAASMGPALQSRAGSYLDILHRLYPATQVLGTQAAWPDMTVEGVRTLDLGGRRMTLGTVGKAHTDNDLWLRDEVTNTLFTGDLVFRTLTPVLEGSITGWMAWMDAPPQPLPALVVPGHGAVAPDWQTAVAAQQTILRELADKVIHQIDAGVPMSEAVPAIVADMHSLAEGWTDFDENTARDATAAYKELEWQ